MNTLAAIAMLSAGVWGVGYAVHELYQSYIVRAYSYISPPDAIFDAFLLINSLVACWLGSRALIDLRRPALPIPGSAMGSESPAASRPIGLLLLTTGVGCFLYTVLTAYIVYGLRSMLPSVDTYSMLALFRAPGVLVTSICACWLGMRLVRRDCGGR